MKYGFVTCLLIAGSFATTAFSCDGAVARQRSAKPNEILALINEVSGSQGVSLNEKLIRVVFIPGILGSKLISSNGDLVWGSNETNNPHLFFDGEQKLQSQFFDSADVPLLLRFFDTDVYGNALLNLSDSNDIDAKDVFRFSYDWRQSNVKSADDLNTFLCSHKSSLENSRVIFVAHSMGGLVLKNWFMNYYDKGITCDGNLAEPWMDAASVHFAGTPHLGAAKALAALFGKYSLFDNWFVRQIMEDGVKKYGYSFDSFYELLPVQNDGSCVEVGQDLGLASAVVNPSNDQSHQDVFGIEFMEYFDLPVAPDLDRAGFRERRLRANLPQVKQRACDLAKYSFPKLGLDKVRVYEGGNSNDTEDNDTIVAFNSTSKEKLLGVGDGTVPRESALWGNVVHNPTARGHAPNPHMKIMNHPSFKRDIQDEVHTIAETALVNLKTVNRAIYDAVIAKLGADQRVVFSPVDEGAGTELAFEINSDIFSSAGLSNDDLLQLSKTAKFESNATREYSSTINQYLVRSKARSEDLLNFEKGKLAKDLMDLGYKADARLVLDEQIPDSLAVIRRGYPGLSAAARDDFKDATAKALNNRGTILQEIGDIEGALADYKMGMKLGSSKAANNYQILKDFNANSQ